MSKPKLTEVKVQKLLRDWRARGCEVRRIVGGKIYVQKIMKPA